MIWIQFLRVFTSPLKSRRRWQCGDCRHSDSVSGNFEYEKRSRRWAVATVDRYLSALTFASLRSFAPDSCNSFCFDMNNLIWNWNPQFANQAKRHTLFLYSWFFLLCGGMILQFVKLSWSRRTANRTKFAVCLPWNWLQVSGTGIGSSESELDCLIGRFPTFRSFVM